MNSELTLLILRTGFLLVLWLFIFAIVYALRSDLFGAPVRRLPSESGGAAASSPPAPASPAASAQQTAEAPRCRLRHPPDRPCRPRPSPRAAAHSRPPVPRAAHSPQASRAVRAPTAPPVGS
ncbi:hypothetical protein [Leucobacter soli]|uniref:hypothetical protein n=1 Tax=Leucobacter soli TaxID=2812850 RepID=UPI003621635B